MGVNTVGMVINLAVDEAFDQCLRRIQLVTILQMHIAIDQSKDIGECFDSYSQQTGGYCVISNDFKEQYVHEVGYALVWILKKR